ncbi:hypothetical protein N7536_006388 [Penicillium majusculum]|nr:hypothetical protein N7536_006388 [Penicillium majusculum]
MASAHAREVVQGSLMSIDTASGLRSARRLEVEITDADATHVTQYSRGIGPALWAGRSRRRHVGGIASVRAQRVNKIALLSLLEQHRCTTQITNSSGGRQVSPPPCRGSLGW